MTASEKLNDLLSYLNINAKVLSENLGYERPQIMYDIQKGKTKRISEELAVKITSVYPNISRSWLLADEGDMIIACDTANAKVSEMSVSDDSLPSYNIVPLVPISAQGGTLNEFCQSVMTYDCEKVVSPIKGVDFAMSVSGDSMAPEYPSGCQILIKKINECAFIDWGKVYVLDTINGSVIKKLMPASTPDKVLCVSINPDYPPFEVSLEHVYGVYRVMMCMSLK